MLMIEPGEEGKNGESRVEENVRMVVSSSEAVEIGRASCRERVL